MSEIQANGPVAANIFVCHSLLNFYNTTPTDVYSGDCSATSWDFVGGHVVTIIGWGTDDEGKDYWLFANSWGPTWGDRGYGRIARGRDTAGIETWEITAVAMARSPQLRSNAPHHEQAGGHDDGQAEAQQQRQQSRSAAAASDIVPGPSVLVDCSCPSHGGGATI
ncbi:cathepsin Blike cysteine proteinase [Acanthamoeba castellanii str. Neff]|uniref:Cathepsin Blike cysteine proteinase n=1 Tax=Acanthamoeba castellanii (strain ATCC 30010 / Neff) TaxID=1257118 RepID=L8H9P1_ACACF|nr:cathepsin Blike cysteine proteinase [Acanthamoeba castellanii str. Neff]ELR21967.1 cathepsin Blike cysteine proteinase [Acanthamoeba castellanii str. Neff]